MPSSILRHVFEADAIFAHELFVHEHDDVVVLGVDRGDATSLGDGLQRFPDIAVLHHAAGVAGPDIGGEDLDAGVAGLHRLREFVVLPDRDLAHQGQVEAVVAVASVLPVCVRLLDRGLNRAVMRALHEVDQRGGAAEQRGAADLGWRVGVFRFGFTREPDRRQAMNVRVDAARYHDLACCIYGARGVGQCSRRADRRDLTVGDTDIRRDGAAWQHACAA